MEYPIAVAGAPDRRTRYRDGLVSAMIAGRESHRNDHVVQDRKP